MASKTIAWKQGSGNIVCTFSGAGDAPVFLTSDANEDLDRQQDLKLVTTVGGLQATLTVRQPGLREEFVTTDDGEWLVAGGEIFGVLK